VPVVQFPFLLFNSDAALLTQLFKLPVSASAVPFSDSTDQLQTCPIYQVFLKAVQFWILLSLHSCSKPFSFSFCCLVVSTISAVHFQMRLRILSFKSFQFQTLLFSLRFYCSVSDTALFTQFFQLFSFSFCCSVPDTALFTQSSKTSQFQLCCLVPISTM
jgi:hypothetical protein